MYKKQEANIGYFFTKAEFSLFCIHFFCIFVQIFE